MNLEEVLLLSPSHSGALVSFCQIKRLPWHSLTLDPHTSLLQEVCWRGAKK